MCSLHDEHRGPQFRQMGRAQLVGPARRMKGITKTQQPGNSTRCIQVIGDHARDAPAHRLAADDERPFRFERIDGNDVFRDELLRAQWRLAAPLCPPTRHVAEFEAGDAEA